MPEQFTGRAKELLAAWVEAVVGCDQADSSHPDARLDQAFRQCSAEDAENPGPLQVQQYCKEFQIQPPNQLQQSAYPGLNELVQHFPGMHTTGTDAPSSDESDSTVL